MKSLIFGVFAVSGVFGQSSTEGTVHCPEGFELIEKKGGYLCTKTVYKKVEVTCPEGLRLRYDDGEPICRGRETQPAEKSCEEGFELSNNRCQKVIEREVEVRCPRGFERDGDRCVREEISHPKKRCTDGSELRNGRCVTVTRSDPELSCKAGELDGDQCVIDKITPAKFRCAEGFQLRNGRCVRVMEEELSYECQEDFELSKDDKTCTQTKITDPKKRCPATHKDGRCFKRETFDKVKSCPEGFELVESHQREFCQKCDEEHAHGGKKCVYSSPEHSCPKGSAPINDNKDSKCFTETDVPFQYVCRRGQGELKEIDGEPKCVKTVTRKAKAVCPEGFNNTGRICREREVEDAKRYCADGQGELKGDRCVMKVRVPSTKRCPEGARLREDQCVLREFTDAELYCKNNQAELVDDMCVLRLEEDLIESCADGFALKDGKCFKKQFSEIQYSCENGFDLVQKEGETAICRKFLEAEPEFSCPEDYTLNEEKMKCQKTITEKPEFHKH